MYALFSDVVMSPIEIAGDLLSSAIPYVIAIVLIVCVLITLLVIRKKKKQKAGQTAETAETANDNDNKE